MAAVAVRQPCATVLPKSAKDVSIAIPANHQSFGLGNSPKDGRTLARSVTDVTSASSTALPQKPSSPVLQRTQTDTFVVRPAVVRPSSPAVFIGSGASPSTSSPTAAVLLQRPRGGCAAFAGHLIIGSPSRPTTSAGVPPVPSSPVAQSPRAKVCRVERPQPMLLLPLPARGSQIDRVSSPAAMLPATAAVPPGLPSRQAASSSRASRVSARFHVLDDQTKLPREVYTRMLQHGEAARGIFGYAQHRLVFAGPNGAPVLRSSAVM